MRNDFETLQKKCKSYHLKKLLKIILPIFSLSILFVVLYLTFSDEKVREETKVKKVISKVQDIKKTKVIVKKETIKVEPIVVKKEISKKRVDETPKKVLKEIKKSKREDVKYALEVDQSYVIKKREKQKIVKEKKNKVIKEEIITDEKREKKLPKVEKEIKKPSFRVDFSKLDTIKKMELKYEKEPKYKIALKIAQTYYDKQNYTKSLLWSKKANILNKKADGAWILYAKSEYARGKKKRAIKILRLYLANASSSEGDRLLLSWRNKD